MAKTKLTPWFDGDTKPVHHGVYETACGFQHWNGKFWGYFCTDKKGAAQYRDYASCVQRDRWRGLASDPAKAGSAPAPKQLEKK